MAETVCLGCGDPAPEDGPCQRCGIVQRASRAPVKIEPTAKQRTAALELRQLFIALTDQGFSERQALTVLGEVIRGAK